MKLKLQYFGHLMQRADSVGKTLMLGKIEHRRRREWQDETVGWHHQLDGHESVQVLGDSEGLGSLACCSQSMGSQRIRHDLATEQQQYQISKELNTLPSVLVSSEEAQFLFFISFANPASFCSYKNWRTRELSDTSSFSQQVGDGQRDTAKA